jgi:hypothetical protein
MIYRAEGRLSPLIGIAAVPVISLIAAVPIIFTGFGCRPVAVPVLSLLRPTLSAAGLILPMLSVVWVHCVIEVANDVVDACAEAGCATGIAVISTIAPAAQSSLARIERLAIY